MRESNIFFLVAKYFFGHEPASEAGVKKKNIRKYLALPSGKKIFLVEKYERSYQYEPCESNMSEQALVFLLIFSGI